MELLDYEGLEVYYPFFIKVGGYQYSLFSFPWRCPAAVVGINPLFNLPGRLIGDCFSLGHQRATLPYVSSIHFPKSIAGKSKSRIMADQKTPRIAKQAAASRIISERILWATAA
jgi:hypothetical protein